MSGPILIAEDDSQTAALLADYLMAEGFEPHCVERGDEVVEWLRSHEVRLMLLDVGLPGRNGIEICREIRRDSEFPIIMVSGRSQEMDRLIGLEIGADDYICKPFSPREVVVRVKTVLRRAGRAIYVQDAELNLDDSACRASYGGHELDLTIIEYKLLRQLARRRGQLFTRTQLIERMYADGRVVTERTVDSHIKKLRKKLDGAVPGADPIHSVYGVGYRYD
jgi:two-component system response regulator BaeR